MTEALEGQVGMFGLDTWCGKTSQEPIPVIPVRTSKPSSRKSSESQSRMPLMLKCLTGEVNGLTRAVTTTTWEDGAWPGAPWMLNTGELRSDENGSLSLRISTDSAPRKYYLRLSCGEKPMTKNPSVLSQVLEEAAEEKYNLSETACLGILNRAERRGKELPTELKEALEIQAGIYQETTIPPSACKETESTGQIPHAVTEPDGVGGGIHA